MSILFYRRPDYLNRPSGPINASDCARYVERAKKSETSIPEGLSFDEILNKQTLAPCSLNDFMDYLVYVEHNAENLQFYLWYKDYCTRFEALSENEKSLSPPFNPTSVEVAEISKSGEAEFGVRERKIGLSLQDTGLPIYNERDDIKAVDSIESPSFRSPTSSDFSSVPSAAEVAVQAGLKWQPFTVQPMREEINRIMCHYLAFTAPRELNLSHKDRAVCLHTLQHTTHPSAFASVARVAETALRGQSHPNFIRWSICNGNKPRVFFVRTMGVSNILFGFLIAVLLTLSKQSRWWRIFAGLQWYLGFVTMVCAYKGLCVILHISHSRCLRPWETTVDELELSQSEVERRDSSASGLQLPQHSRNPGYESSTGSIKDLESGSGGFSYRSSLRTFGPKNDGWENESWVEEYRRKVLLRKVFDKSVWTKNETLRVLQDRIVIGANFWALVITIPLTVIFVALPKGNYY